MFKTFVLGTFDTLYENLYKQNKIKLHGKEGRNLSHNHGKFDFSCTSQFLRIQPGVTLGTQ